MGRFILQNRRVMLLLVFLFAFRFLGAQEDAFVSIYDDVSDSAFGRSASRSIIRGVRLDRFALYRTLDVERELLDGKGEKGFLTPLVFSDEKKKLLEEGAFEDVSDGGEGIYRLSGNGVDISFSLEKPGAELYGEIDSYYEKWPEWREPVRNRYRDNWVIRIHRAENVFEPWIDRITYNEALLAAALIADGDQWLWGVHDGADYLDRK